MLCMLPQTFRTGVEVSLLWVCTFSPCCARFIWVLLLSPTVQRHAVGLTSVQIVILSFYEAKLNPQVLLPHYEKTHGNKGGCIPDMLTVLGKHGWILCTLSFLSTWSSGDRSKNVNTTSDLEYWEPQKACLSHQGRQHCNVAGMCMHACGCRGQHFHGDRPHPRTHLPGHVDSILQ